MATGKGFGAADAGSVHNVSRVTTGIDLTVCDLNYTKENLTRIKAIYRGYKSIVYLAVANLLLALYGCGKSADTHSERGLGALTSKQQSVQVKIKPHRAPTLEIAAMINI